KPAIIAGDFNLHHPSWNCTATPQNVSKAARLVRWLESSKATLLTDNEQGSQGTFHRSNLKSTSIIDLSFYTSFKKLTWGGWTIGAATGSDHEAIAFQAYTSKPTTTTST